MSDFLPPWSVPPGLLLLGTAPLLALLTGLPRKVLQVAVPSLVLWQVFALYGPAAAHLGASFHWMGADLDLLHVDATRLIFGTIFAIMALLGSIYALHLDDGVQNASAWVYAGGALGVTFAGDLLTFLVFWELMGISSAFLVFAGNTDDARAAGLRYLAVHGLGGSIFLAGIVAWTEGGGTTLVSAIPLDAGLPGWLMLVGISINAAVPPLGAWLPDAYPNGSVTGSVFLSAFTTKTAVFALVVLFPGWPILQGAGLFMAIWGTIYSLQADDLRRVLAYQIVAQVGFMVAAVGIGSPMALDGASAHAFAHILYKSLLFMGAGAILFATGRSRLSELSGLRRRLPGVFWLFLIGAATMSALPLTASFATKSILITAAGRANWPIGEVVMTLAAVGTLLAALRVVWFAFVGPDHSPPDEPLRAIPRNMYVAMGLGAALCLFIGDFVYGHHWLYERLPFRTAYHPYTLHHVLESLQMAAACAVAFWVIRARLEPRPGVTLDTDWLYRLPLRRLLLGLSRAIYRGQTAFGERVGRGVRRGAAFLRNPLVLGERLFGRGIIEPHPDGVYDENWYRLPVGFAVLVMLTIFALVALLHLATGNI